MAAQLALEQARNMKKSPSDFSCDSVDDAYPHNRTHQHDDKERISIKSEFSGIDKSRRLSIVNARGKKVSAVVEVIMLFILAPGHEGCSRGRHGTHIKTSRSHVDHYCTGTNLWESQAGRLEIKLILSQDDISWNSTWNDVGYRS